MEARPAKTVSQHRLAMVGYWLNTLSRTQSLDPLFQRRVTHKQLLETAFTGNTESHHGAFQFAFAVRLESLQCSNHFLLTHQ